MSSNPGLLPPHSVETEEAFLGSLIINPDLICDVTGTIKTDDFYIVRNAWIFGAMLMIYQQGQPVEYVSLVEKLKELGKLEDIGGPAYITYLVNQAPRLAYVEAHGQIIGEKAFRRRMIGAASDLAHLAHDDTGDMNTVIEGVTALLDGLLEAKPEQELRLQGKRAISFYRDVLKSRVSDGKPDLITLPWKGAARAVPVVPLGKIITLSGFAGQGKSILIEQVSEWAAMLGNRCFVVDGEMTRQDHLDRMACRHAGLTYADVQQPGEKTEDILRALEYETGDWLPRIEWWETNKADSDQVLSQIRRAMQHGFRYFFLDYLQRIPIVVPRGKSYKEALDRFLYDLETLVKQNELALFIASQLSHTEFGPATKGTNVLNEISALHIRLETAEQKEDCVYSVDDRLIAAKKGKKSPLVTAKLAKNRFGDQDADWVMFRDGARFRFLDEDEVTSTLDIGSMKSADSPSVPVRRNDPANLDLEGF